MISIGQLRKHIADAAARVDADLAAATLAHAQFAAETARGYIGHLQGAVVTPPPVPSYVPAWEPLAAATVDDKAAMGFTPPDYEPLLRTGEMHESISGTAVGLTGVVGSTDEKAVYHELGTATMPPRPFLARAVVETTPLLAMTLGMIGLDLLTPSMRRGGRP